MFTVFRSNRAEWLADLLATQLREAPPGPFETVQVVVNTWPTSRWLGERLAVGLGGIAANIRFPFPGSQLRRIVNGVLGDPAGGHDPWRASELVWPVLELLPELVASAEGEVLRRWLERRQPRPHGPLELSSWQLGRAIADALDDASLYRPELLQAWWNGAGSPAPEGSAGAGDAPSWQPRLVQQLGQKLGVKPFGLRMLEAIERLGSGAPLPGQLPPVLRLFGLSSMAPVQVKLLHALSAHSAVDLYLLTPGADLWQRCGSRRAALSDAIALNQPLEGDWLLEAPGLEARFGRLGGEFQQLLEGCGEVQLGVWQERDLFADATGGQGDAPLLCQLQRQLAAGHETTAAPLQRMAGDRSLEFHPCPGRLRQLQIVRDRILQLLADDPTLQPRDVLVMTPQVDAFAPLVACVFGDRDATGVELAWRLTDRSQQSEASLGRTLLQLLLQAGDRFTASGLEALLESTALRRRFQLDAEEIAELHGVLQRLGFRWGLEAGDRGGAGQGSLAWACDRLLLGLVLPEEPGLAPGEVAPFDTRQGVELVGRWLHLLERLRHWLTQLRQPRPCDAWVECLQALLSDLFVDGGDRDWELPAVLTALDDWQQAAGSCALELPATVVAAGLDERLAADSGRFGHRSGALTISALEPMRAIPHRVIVLMGLDAGVFPRQNQRPGFHPLERRRQLGDPNPADQDRYVLLEALLSARDHLLITWSSRDERKGEELPPATPVRQWLDWLEQQLGQEQLGELVRAHPANPLDRRNFLPTAEHQPPSCDRRLLTARRQLEAPEGVPPPQPLALSPPPPPQAPQAPEQRTVPAGDRFTDLRDWLVAPQARWLADLGLHPREWADTLSDLDALVLDERERARLLRLGLAEWVAEGSGPADPGDPAHWLHSQRGRGCLPPFSAAELEAGQLAGRWCDLQQTLLALGEPEERRPLHWEGWCQELCWRGDSLVLLHTAKARGRHLLDLWLQLLLAAAADAAPRQAVLVARGEKGFGIQQRLGALDADTARQQLAALATLRENWRQRCWPVPPETGWAWLRQGERQAVGVWEGSDQVRGERQEPEQALCFGPQRPGVEMLQPPFDELATAWAGPLLAHLESSRP